MLELHVEALWSVAMLIHEGAELAPAGVLAAVSVALRCALGTTWTGEA